jgi:hypothetical protein
LSFGRSSSVGGGVRKLGLGVAGTGGVISAQTGVSDTCGGIPENWTVVVVFEQGIRDSEPGHPSYF